MVRVEPIRVLQAKWFTQCQEALSYQNASCFSSLTKIHTEHAPSSFDLLYSYLIFVLSKICCLWFMPRLRNLGFLFRGEVGDSLLENDIPPVEFSLPQAALIRVRLLVGCLQMVHARSTSSLDRSEGVNRNLWLDVLVMDVAEKALQL